MFHQVTDELAVLSLTRGKQGCWEGAVTTACFHTMSKWADTQCSQELPESHNKTTAQLYTHDLTIGNALISLLSFSCFFGLVIFLYILANIYLAVTNVISQ